MQLPIQLQIQLSRMDFSKDYKKMLSHGGKLIQLITATTISTARLICLITKTNQIQQLKTFVVPPFLTWCDMPMVLRMLSSTSYVMIRGSCSSRWVFILDTTLTNRHTVIQLFMAFLDCQLWSVWYLRHTFSDLLFSRNIPSSY